MRRVLLVVAAVVALVGSAACAPPATTADLQVAVNRVVFDGIPGAVSYTRQGNLLALPVAGVRDLTTRETIRTTDRFRIASVTKSFVAATILQLVGEGRMSLDDSVERYLPGLVPAGGGISVRQLLNHTSGLFDYVNDYAIDLDELSPALKPYLEDGIWDYYWEPAALVRMAVEHPPHFAPGTSWRYSNTNYVVAGMIVQAVTGRSIADEVTQRFIGPLNLAGTSFPTREATIAGEHTQGYLNARREDGTTFVVDVTTFSPSFLAGAGGMVSTPADISAFFRALFTGSLLAPAQKAELLRTVPVPGNVNVSYGLGVFALNTPCGTAWGHDGSFPGYVIGSFMTLDGSRQVSVGLNSNPVLGSAAGADYDRAIVAGLCGRDTGALLPATPAEKAAEQTVTEAALAVGRR